MKNMSNLMRHSNQDVAANSLKTSQPMQAEQLSELFPHISRLETYVLYGVLDGQQSAAVHQYVDYLTQKQTWEERQSAKKTGKRSREILFTQGRQPE